MKTEIRFTIKQGEFLAPMRYYKDIIMQFEYKDCETNEWVYSYITSETIIEAEELPIRDIDTDADELIREIKHYLAFAPDPMAYNMMTKIVEFVRRNHN